MTQNVYIGDQFYEHSGESSEYTVDAENHINPSLMLTTFATLSVHKA